jgi:DNA-binding NarL/FixJ family response regulator
MINIYIIDDHPIIIQGLKNMFKSNSDKLHISGFSTNLVDALIKIKLFKVDVILLDLYLEDTDSLNNIKLLTVNYPNKPIIIFTGETSIMWEIKTFQEGVKAYILKSDHIKVIRETILSVYEGNLVIPSELADYSKVNNHNIFSKNNPLRLTSLVIDLANGLNLKEIATKNHKTVSAIEKSLNSLRQEYGAKTNAELVKIFCQHKEI